MGDTVRVSKNKNIFGRGFEPNFSDEIFEVSKVYQGDPVTYEIQDHTGEKIIGRFCEEELSVIKKKDDVFRIDKVLLTAVIIGVGVILGGILSKSDLQSRVTQSRFAYATYEGILHQIKAILRSGNFDSDTEIVFISELCLIDSIVTDCCPSVDNLFKKYESKYSANFDQKDSTDGLVTDLCKSAQICLKKYDSKS